MSNHFKVGNRGEVDLSAGREHQAHMELAELALQAEEHFGSPVKYIMPDGQFELETPTLDSVADQAHRRAVQDYTEKFRALIERIGSVPEEFAAPSQEANGPWEGESDEE